ncbi:prepilin-type cleavage/methylation-like protein [Oceanimonas sp. MB9]|uniref:prepilin-type cleavage/methylation-like protein n=1 Tax=Oceanimonas sp. MB9 TaxID=2588453 RepID=UPI00351A0266
MGLAVLAIILVGTGLFISSQPRQLDPVFQFRAVALAEVLSEQVLAVKYDGQNDPYADEHKRCGIGSAPACRNASTAGAGAGIEDFSHVDDFRLWCGDDNAITGNVLADQLKLTRAPLYARYTVQTCVTLNTDDPSATFKEVIISIADQNGSDLSFTLHRYNIR